MIQQVKEFHDGARVGANPTWTPIAHMRQASQAASAQEVEAAARWFAAQRYVPAFRLVEAREIMAVKPLVGVYAPRPGGGRELLGERIVEVPNDLVRFELRDNRPGYTVYVPPGSIARGRTLAETGGSGRFAPCASCHGPGLKGDFGPPLAGRYPAYLFRQFLAFSGGGRHGAGAAPMGEIASKLKPDEMIALSAYAASLAP